MIRPIAFLVILMVVGGWLMPTALQAEDITRLQSGVVKITAKSSGGSQRIGTGFIVHLDKAGVYIVTAAHVVAGDPHPQVEFFTKRNAPVLADVLPGVEGGDEVRGLALLTVKGKENIPPGLAALSFGSNVRLSGGEDIVLKIGRASCRERYLFAPGSRHFLFSDRRRRKFWRADPSERQSSGAGRRRGSVSRPRRNRPKHRRLYRRVWN